MKKLLVILVLLSYGSVLPAQTLFSYGRHKVDKEEFLRAFKRNNTSGYGNQALRDYLALYIAFKLKVQAARDQKMDTLPAQINDLLNFRRQLEADYLVDDEVIHQLTREAFARSQHDIRVSHVFVPFNINNIQDGSNADTSMAFHQIQRAYSELEKGAAFEVVAGKYSGDPAVKDNHGDMGFITLFTLPYNMESIVYGLPDGSYSKPYRSKAGYHLFKRTATRPAAGKWSAAQILLAYSPLSSAEEKRNQKKLADSLYRVLQAGADFTALAKQFSAERNVSLTGGVIPEITAGSYDPVFEQAVFGLQHDGDITVPFETTFGIHIVKRIRRYPVSGDSTLAEALFKEPVTRDERFNIARIGFARHIVNKVGYRKHNWQNSLLWQLSDDYLLTGQWNGKHQLTGATALFSFEKEEIKVKNWLAYLESVKGKYPAGSLHYADLMEQFVAVSAETYYRKHLEEYDSDFRQRLTAFAEGNLLFEIMEAQVWEKAASDKTGLEAYYNQHREKYTWAPGANAIAFNTVDPGTAEEVVQNINAYIGKWKTLAESTQGKIFADSSRFEFEQIPGERKDVQPGQVTRRVTDTSTGSTHFMYILNITPQPSQRSFVDARGMVINDYQSVVEARWIATLKKKYPVNINEKLLQALTQ